jgi:hypothetical protein
VSHWFSDSEDSDSDEEDMASEHLAKKQKEKAKKEKEAAKKDKEAAKKAAAKKKSGAQKAGKTATSMKRAPSSLKQAPASSRKRTPAPVDEVSLTSSTTASSVSETLESTKRSRRETSVSSLGESARLKKYKDKSVNLKEDNINKDNEIHKLTQEREDMQRQLDAFKAQNAHLEQQSSPSTTSRRSSKKRHADGKQKKPVVQVDTESFIKKTSKAQFRYAKFVKNEKDFRKSVGGRIIDLI